MSDAPLKPIYLLRGDDTVKIGRSLKRLRGRVGEAAVEQRNAKNFSGAEAGAELMAFPLGHDQKLVIVRECERWKSDDIAALSDYLAAPVEGAVLVLLGSPAEASRLVRLVVEHGETHDFPLPDSDLPAWVATELGRAGATVTKSAVRAILELAGSNLDRLSCEIEKLAVYADGGRVDEKAVRNLVAPRALDPSAFALGDAWGSGHVREVLRACETLERATGGRRDEWIRLVSGLLAHVRRVIVCRALIDQRISPGAAAKRLGLHPYVVEKSYAQASRRTAPELARAFARIVELESELKGGSQLPPVMVVERALVDAVQR